MLTGKIWTSIGLPVLSARCVQTGVVHKEGHTSPNTSWSTAIALPTTIVYSETTTVEYESSSNVRRTYTSWVSQHSSVAVPNTTCSTSIPHYTPHSHSRTTTTTVNTTITPCPTPTTPTYISTYNRCPTECSVSAGTVNLFFWPIGNDYLYPTTFVDTALGYTFTSPSLYMVVDTIFGYNSAGPTGPSATSKVFPLDLDEVSTIVPGSGATRQLTLNDLGTNCPQTEEASLIATMTAGGSCDPVLAAPSEVKTWAYPCGACGPFGLFDPPYAIPAVPVPSTTAVETTATPVPTATESSVSSTSTIPPVQTALALRRTGGFSFVIFSIFTSVILW